MFYHGGGFRQQGNIEAVVEKWRAIANIVEEDLQLQARAWFSIGYLRSEGEGIIDLEAAIDASSKVIELVLWN